MEQQVYNNIDNRTKEIIINYSFQDWYSTVEMILNNKVINLKINFSEFDSEVRLKELYDILVLINDESIIDNYNKSIYSLLEKYYGNTLFSKQIIILSNIIDYSKPVKYVDFLISKVLNPEYKNMSITTYENGFAIQYYLINSLINFDSDNRILNYLMTKSTVLQVPEYYQTTLRRIYTVNNKQMFATFMNNINSFMKREYIMLYLTNSIDECVYNTKSVKLIYFWIKENNITGKILIDENLKFFVEELAKWVVNRENEYSNYTCMNELRNYIFYFINMDNKYSLEYEIRMTYNELSQKRRKVYTKEKYYSNSKPRFENTKKSLLGIA